MPKINLKGMAERIVKSRTYEKLWPRAPLIGGLLGLPLGAVVGYHTVPSMPRPTTYKRKEGEELAKFRRRAAGYRKRVATEHVSAQRAAAAMGGFQGFGLGWVGGRSAQVFAPYPESYHEAFRQAARDMGKPLHETAQKFQSSVRKVKTKVDAQSMFRRMALKTHPDKGGDRAVFMDVKRVWDQFKRSGKFDKLAFLKSMYGDAFTDELEKVAKSNLTPAEQWKVYDIKQQIPKDNEYPLWTSLPTIAGPVGGIFLGSRIGGMRGMAPGIVIGGLSGSIASILLGRLYGKSGKRTQMALKQIRKIKEKAKARA